MKERKKKNEIKKQKGITLIALVITIIILIILATVTINVVLGEGGLIDRAKLAKEMTEQAIVDEQKELNGIMDEFTNIMSEDSTIPEPEINETVEEPAKTITFSIDGETYTAEEGMTWEEWVESDYNTTELLVSKNGIISEDINAYETNVSAGGTPEPGTHNVKKGETIIADKSYDYFYGFVTYSTM